MLDKPQFDVSVIIPSYNYAHYLKKAVSSVMQQRIIAAEIIIVDDGSTDDTRQVVQWLQKEYEQFRLLYYYQENKGVSAARNYGFSKSSGEYLLFLDADDKLLPHAFEYLSSAVKKNTYPDMLFGGYQAVSYSGELRERNATMLSLDNLENVVMLLNGDMVGLRLSCCVLKRSILSQTKFLENVHVDEDTMFFSHVLAKYNCVSIPELIVEMPRHEGSLREDYQRIIETGVEGVEELFANLPINLKMTILKRKVLVKRHLKVARKACINKYYKIASDHYKQAFITEPTSIMNMKHLPRAIKSILLQYL